MLILSRRVDERIMIGEEIEISVVDIKGDQVKIGISAPRTIKVYRKEVFQAIQQENIEAAKARPSVLPQLDRILGGGGRASPTNEPGASPTKEPGASPTKDAAGAARELPADRPAGGEQRP